MNLFKVDPNESLYQKKSVQKFNLEMWILTKIVTLFSFQTFRRKTAMSSELYYAKKEGKYVKSEWDKFE